MKKQQQTNNTPSTSKTHTQKRNYPTQKNQVTMTLNGIY